MSDTGRDGAVLSACDFARQYECAKLPEMLAIERRVTGCGYGGTSWTTRAEADHIADLLGLKPGVRFLEIGAGSGWPGLYLADTSGCDVVLTDIPASALALARTRAATDGLAERCVATAADGAALPFADASFQRLGHSDVLCCLPAKVEVLTECRRVACDGAVMVFSVIAPALALDDAAHRTALAAGPPFVDTPADYALLLRDAGWQVTERLDVSARYKDSNRVYLGELLGRESSLSGLLGAREWADRVQRRKQSIAALDAGLLRREIFVTRADSA